jgi:hypothetical protein
MPKNTKTADLGVQQKIGIDSGTIPEKVQLSCSHRCSNHREMNVLEMT